MKTRSNLRRQLQDAFDKVEFICRHGNFYSGLEATEVAHDAYTLACRHGCAIEMPKMGTAHDALRLVGMLLKWADGKERPADGMLNLKQAAAYLGYGSRGLREIVDRTRKSRAGQHVVGPMIEFSQGGKGGTILFRREWLDDFIEANRVRPGRLPPPKVRKRAAKPGTEMAAAWNALARQ